MSEKIEILSGESQKTFDAYVSAVTRDKNAFTGTYEEYKSQVLK